VDDPNLADKQYKGLGEKACRGGSRKLQYVDILRKKEGQADVGQVTVCPAQTISQKDAASETTGEFGGGIGRPTMAMLFSIDYCATHSRGSDPGRKSQKNLRSREMKRSLYSGEHGKFDWLPSINLGGGTDTK